MWPLAALVFFASVAVPVLKLVGLGILLISTHMGTSKGLHDRTILYRVVDAIGRWSMIDIFMESILVALVQFGQLASVYPGPGAIAFAAVVILTMLAARSFDPRLMWDSASMRNRNGDAGRNGMSDRIPGPPQPTAVVRSAIVHKRRWSLIWAIPIVTVIIGGWAGLANDQQPGPVDHRHLRDRRRVAGQPVARPPQGR